MLPSARLIVMVMAAGPIFLAGAFFPPLVAAGTLYLLVLTLYVLADLAMLPGRKSIEIRRLVPERGSLSAPTRIVVEVRNLTRRPMTIQVVDDLPEPLEARDARAKGLFAPGAEGSLEYYLFSPRRGRFRIERLNVRLPPAMGLFFRQMSLPLPADVLVYPNLANLRCYDLMVRRGLLHEQGLAWVRRLGQGSRFESLRAYAPGDPLTTVEWKASAKRSRLVVKNYQPEREQSVMVALDVGRATAGEFGDLSRLDYFINATMVLAYVVLRQGDWFSLVAFSDRIESYLPPVRHVRNVERVAQALYRLEPRLVESDYAGACRFLGLKNRKRSLICLMTDIIGREANADIIAYMGRFARTHLPLVVTLTDTQVHALAESPLARSSDPYSQAVALDVLAARAEALQSMRRGGVGVLDARPDELNPDLINRYTWIKASRML